MDRDLKGNIIIQRPKDSRSIEIDGTGRFCGHRFLLKTKLYGDKRCIYCGKWFHWKDTDYLTWLKQDNIDDTNADNNIEPLHCGSLHCQDYHYLYKKAQKRRMEELGATFERRALRAYKILKKAGLVG
jgi:hypothetical protein